jgi:hypothetical protein
VKSNSKKLIKQPALISNSRRECARMKAPTCLGCFEKLAHLGFCHSESTVGHLCFCKDCMDQYPSPQLCPCMAQSDGLFSIVVLQGGDVIHQVLRHLKIDDETTATDKERCSTIQDDQIKVVSFGMEE